MLRGSCGGGGSGEGEWATCYYFCLSKAGKTLFPNMWHRPLILWVWGRMKESEGRRKEAGGINREKTLLGVAWICFTPRRLDCFLFLHTTATKLRIPIGRYRNARQQQGNKRFLGRSRWRKRYALVPDATGAGVVIGKQGEHLVQCCFCILVNEKRDLQPQRNHLKSVKFSNTCSYWYFWHLNGLTDAAMKELLQRSFI